MELEQLKGLLEVLSEYNVLEYQSQGTRIVLGGASSMTMDALKDLEKEMEDEMIDGNILNSPELYSDGHVPTLRGADTRDEQ